MDPKSGPGDHDLFDLGPHSLCLLWNRSQKFSIDLNVSHVELPLSIAS